LAILQRLELLLKFPAKTEENSFGVFMHPGRTPKKHHLPTPSSLQENWNLTRKLDGRDHQDHTKTLELLTLSGKISNQLPFFILSSLVSPADQTRPNFHQFSISRSQASQFFFFFIVDQAGPQRKVFIQKGGQNFFLVRFLIFGTHGIK
jgi:hypothetical protein